MRKVLLKGLSWWTRPLLIWLESIFSGITGHHNWPCALLHQTAHHVPNTPCVYESPLLLVMFSELELSSQSASFTHFHSFFKTVSKSYLLWEVVYNSLKKSGLLYPKLPDILNSSIPAWWATLATGSPSLHSEKGGGILSFLLAKTFHSISPLLLMNVSDISELGTGKRGEKQEEQGSIFLWVFSWWSHSLVWDDGENGFCFSWPLLCVLWRPLTPTLG